MNVLMVSGTFDIGGQGARIVEAFRKHTDWVVRSMVRVASYLGYPTDLPYRRRDMEDRYRDCDVFHARVNFGEYDRLAAKFGPKPVVIHYHGTAFRANPNRYLREQRERGAIGIVSTLDLWLLAPDELEWLPAPYDVDALTKMR